MLAAKHSSKRRTHKHSSKSKSPVNRAVAALLGFLPAAFISVAAVACIAYFAFLSPAAFVRSFQSSGYYSGIQSYSYEKMGDKLIPTGLPASVLDNTLPEEDVKLLADASITGSTEQTTAAKEDIAGRLQGNIALYIQQQGIPASAVDNSEIEAIVDDIVDFYATAATLPAAGSIRRLANTVRSILPFAVAGCVLGAAAAVFMLYKLLQWKHVLLRYIAWSTGGAGLILTVLPLITKLLGGYKRINLAPEYMYNLMVQHIGNTLNLCLLCGGILLLTCAALAFAAEVQRKKVL